jgi:hypothetical protein
MSGDFPSVAPLPGAGLVARAGDLLLTVVDAPGAEELLGVFVAAAAEGVDGNTLVRRAVALIAADEDGRLPACALGGPSQGRFAVLVYGTARAEVTGADGTVRLSGADAITAVSRFVPGPVTSVRLLLPGVDPSATVDSRLFLGGGVVPGAGLVAGTGAAGSTTHPLAAAPPVATPVSVSAPPVPVTAPPVVAPPRTPAESPLSTQALSASELLDSGPLPGPDAMAPARSVAPAESMTPADAMTPGPPVAPGPQALPGPPAGPPYPPPAGPPYPPPAPAGPPYAAPPAGPPYPPPPPPQPSAPPAAQAGPPAPPSIPSLPRIPDAAKPFVSVILLPDLQPPVEPMPAPEPVDPRPKVLGVLCKNDHFNDPDLRYCQVCGISMAQQTLIKHEGPRPPLGVLLFDDGMTFRLDTDYLVGRDPALDPGVTNGAARPLRVVDPQNQVSRAHLRIALVGWQVQLIDQSANGTYLRLPAQDTPTRMNRGQAVTLKPGAQVYLGQRWFRYESHRNP